jgi:hypothetical protein
MSAPTGTKRFWGASGAINAGTAVDLRTPHNSSSTVYVTKFTVSITTHANGKIVQLQDSAGSPVVYAKRTDLTAAAGVPDTITWDFGKVGIPMTLGKKAQGMSESSGPSGWFYAEGYEIVPNPAFDAGV